MFKVSEITSFTGHQILELNECASTNEFLQAFLKEKNVEEGFILITSKQTAGKGQRGNQWLTESDVNLTFSLLYNPTFLALHQQFYLSIAVALGISDTLSEFTNTYIKWPNDIYTKNKAGKYKKLGGILIENTIKKNQFDQSIIGIGININQSKFPFSGPSSLYIETGKYYELNEFFQLLLPNLEKRYLQLMNGQLILLENEYLSRLFLLNKESTFITNNKIIKGSIQGIDQLGRLIISSENNELAFSVGEIDFIEKAD